MSTLLEQAIVDAEALKEVALKNAETRILEKYSNEVKNTLNTLLEQEEEEDPLGLGGEEGGDEFGGDLGGDMGLGGEEETLEDEPVVKDMPDAFADGEKLCPCPDEEEEIEIDFNDLARQLQDPEESEPDDMIDREEELGLGGEEEEEEEEGGLGALMERLMEEFGAEEEEGEPIEGLEENEESDLDTPEGEETEEEILEAFESILTQTLLEDVTLDGDVASSGYGGLTKEEAEEAQMLSAAQALASADEKDTKEFKDEELGEIVTGEKEQHEETAILQREKVQLTERLKRTKAHGREQISDLRKQNKGLKNKISILQEQVLKVNLVNAKLLYTNKALQSASLNERQKHRIVESLTKASSVEEAKTIYETLQSTVSSAAKKRAPNSLSEAVNRGRTSTLFANRRKQEEKPNDAMISKWRILAGLDKE